MNNSECKTHLVPVKDTVVKKLWEKDTTKFWEGVNLASYLVYTCTCGSSEEVGRDEGRGVF